MNYNANSLTRERVDALATKIDKELPSGSQNVWELPDGYQFTDENGNVINVTKIFLEKKKKEYPKTYEECAAMMGVGLWNTLWGAYANEYEEQTENLIDALIRLKVCRDAYWKIAGEEMGLGKSWKPDWNTSVPKYVIACTNNGIEKQWETTYCKFFAFPTEAIRELFYENFKELIESCKELL